MDLTKNIENLSEFLQKTEYCDSDNPDIKNLAEKITKGLQTDKEKAMVKSAYGFWATILII